MSFLKISPRQRIRLLCLPFLNEKKIKDWTRFHRRCFRSASIPSGKAFCVVAPLREITNRLSSPTSCLQGLPTQLTASTICSQIIVGDNKYLGTTKQRSFCLFFSANTTYQPHKHTVCSVINLITHFTKSFLLGENINSLKSQSMYLITFDHMFSPATFAYDRDRILRQLKWKLGLWRKACRLSRWQNVVEQWHSLYTCWGQKALCEGPEGGTRKDIPGIRWSGPGASTAGKSWLEFADKVGLPSYLLLRVAIKRVRCWQMSLHILYRRVYPSGPGGERHSRWSWNLIGAFNFLWLQTLNAISPTCLQNAGGFWVHFQCFFFGGGLFK